MEKYKLIEPDVILIYYHHNVLGAIDRAARVCYATENSNITPEDRIRKLIKLGHESVLEHSSFTFNIVCSRSCLAQITRHRIGFSFSVQSQRYVNYDKKVGFKFIVPKDVKDNLLLLDNLDKVCYDYSELIKSGYKPEDARSILPNCMATEIIMTVNARSLRNFLKLRLDKHAQDEIRQISLCIVNEIKRIGCECLIEDLL